MASSRPLASMTGFARVIGAEGGLAWAFEAKSVNGKSLDLRVRLPQGQEGLELPLRQAAQRHLTRGNVQLNLSFDRGGAEPVRLAINEPLLEEMLALARKLEARGLAPASVDGLLSLRGIVEPVEETADEKARESQQAALLADAERLFQGLAAQRAQEGAALGATLLAQLDLLAELVSQAAGLAGAQPQAIRARLAAQVADLLGTQPGLTEERLAQEVALLAVKADVREELDRLTAHGQEVRRLIEEGGAVGRKLDFLCQELNREANTLCSKAADLETTRVGLALKGLVDQLREQVQNVE
jgi:uncharacterized protein (TIGR00255 family)